MNRTILKIKGQAKKPVAFSLWEIICLLGVMLIIGLAWPGLLKLVIAIVWEIFQ